MGISEGCFLGLFSMTRSTMQMQVAHKYTPHSAQYQVKKQYTNGGRAVTSLTFFISMVESALSAFGWKTRYCQRRDTQLC